MFDGSVLCQQGVNAGMSQQVCVVGRRAARKECNQALAFVKKGRMRIREERSGSPVRGRVIVQNGEKSGER